MLQVCFSPRPDFPISGCTLPDLSGPVLLTQNSESITLCAIQDASTSVAVLPTWAASYFCEEVEIRAESVKVEIKADPTDGNDGNLVTREPSGKEAPISSTAASPDQPLGVKFVGKQGVGFVAVKCPLDLLGIPDLPQTVLRQAIVHPNALTAAMVLGTPTVWRMRVIPVTVDEGVSFVVPPRIQSEEKASGMKPERRLYTGVPLKDVDFDGLRLPLNEVMWKHKQPQRWVRNFVRNHEPLTDVVVLTGLDLLPSDSIGSVLTDLLEILPASKTCGVCDSLLRVPQAFKKHWVLEPKSMLPAVMPTIHVEVDEVEVIGYETQVSSVDLALVQRLMHKKLFQDMGLDSTFPKLLLHGPAGVGKTHLLNHCLARLPFPRIYVHPKDLLGRYVGEGEQALSAAFAKAWDERGILIFENLDAWVPQRDQEDVPPHVERLVASFLVLLDGISAQAPAAILATSKTAPEWLDSRVCRPGRIDTWIPLPMPDGDTRNALARHYKTTTVEGDSVRDICSRAGMEEECA